MEVRLTIGQVAKTSGVAAKTIRYYEQIGVLPVPSRGVSGYRLYDEPGVERLRFIRRAPRPPLRPRLRALVREQLNAVNNQIAELELLRQQLEQVFERMQKPVRRRAGGACQCLETRSAPADRRLRDARRSGSSGVSP